MRSAAVRVSGIRAPGRGSAGGLSAAPALSSPHHEPRQPTARSPAGPGPLARPVREAAAGPADARGAGAGRGPDPRRGRGDRRPRRERAVDRACRRRHESLGRSRSPRPPRRPRRPTRRPRRPRTPARPRIPAHRPRPRPRPAPQPSPTPTPRPTVKPVHHGGPIPAATLQARLDQARARLKLPGVTVAILWDDGRQWTGASGQRNVAANDPMTTDTALGLASISKTLTAAVVLELVDEGRITLDQPVAPLLPEYALAPPDHGPQPARPHERPARLLPQREDRPAAPASAGRDVDGRPTPGATCRRSVPRRTGTGSTPTRTTCCSASSSRR